MVEVLDHFDWDSTCAPTWNVWCGYYMRKFCIKHRDLDST
jgi:hypothetical protein